MFNHASQSGFKTHGIGLGLTTARKLTEAMLGGIHLISKENEGTEVGFSTLCLPSSHRLPAANLKAHMIRNQHTLDFAGLRKRRM